MTLIIKSSKSRFRPRVANKSTLFATREGQRRRENTAAALQCSADRGFRAYLPIGHRIIGHDIIGHRIIGHRIIGHMILFHTSLKNLSFDV